MDDFHKHVDMLATSVSEAQSTAKGSKFKTILNDVVAKLNELFEKHEDIHEKFYISRWIIDLLLNYGNEKLFQSQMDKLIGNTVLIPGLQASVASHLAREVEASSKQFSSNLLTTLFHDRIKNSGSTRARYIFSLAVARAQLKERLTREARYTLLSIQGMQIWETKFLGHNDDEWVGFRYAFKLLDLLRDAKCYQAACQLGDKLMSTLDRLHELAQCEPVTDLQVQLLQILLKLENINSNGCANNAILSKLFSKWARLEKDERKQKQHMSESAFCAMIVEYGDIKIDVIRELLAREDKLLNFFPCCIQLLTALTKRERIDLNCIDGVKNELRDVSIDGIDSTKQLELLQNVVGAHNKIVSHLNGNLDHYVFAYELEAMEEDLARYTAAIDKYALSTCSRRVGKRDTQVLSEQALRLCHRVAVLELLTQWKTPPAKLAPLLQKMAGISRARDELPNDIPRISILGRTIAFWKVKSEKEGMVSLVGLIVESGLPDSNVTLSEDEFDKEWEKVRNQFIKQIGKAFNDEYCWTEKVLPIIEGLKQCTLAADYYKKSGFNIELGKNFGQSNVISGITQLRAEFEAELQRNQKKVESKMELLHSILAAAESSRRFVDAKTLIDFVVNSWHLAVEMKNPSSIEFYVKRIKRVYYKNEKFMILKPESQEAVDFDKRSFEICDKLDKLDELGELEKSHGKSHGTLKNDIDALQSIIDSTTDIPLKNQMNAVHRNIKQDFES